MNFEVSLPQSLIIKINQNPQEDIVALCSVDIAEYYMESKLITPEDFEKMKTNEFQAKLASQIFTRGLQKTFLEHPEYVPENWEEINKNGQTETQKISEAITSLRVQNKDFSRDFTLNIFTIYTQLRNSPFKS